MNKMPDTIEINYTVVVCNFEMGDTLSESVRSIYTQLTEEFEVLIVDGGSSHNSTEELNKLENKFKRVRSVRLSQESQRRLGEERNIGVREAHGEYILLQMDADDRYDPGILEFVEVYHRIQDCIEKEIYLKGNAINIASRDFLIKRGPYRNIHAGEDEDLWRRLFAEHAIIWLDHVPFVEEIKDYNPGTYGKFKRVLDKRTGDIQSRVSLSSCLYWSIVCEDHWWSPLIYLLAYLNSLNRESYETPKPFDKKEAVKTVIEYERATLPKHETRLDINIGSQKLSDSGKELFYQDG